MDRRGQFAAGVSQIRQAARGSGGRRAACRCLCIGGRGAKPSNRQGTALLNQDHDPLDHRVAGKAESRIGQEWACARRE